MKLLSGSCYLPHPAKEETGGEDAHFICGDEQVIGVADGVGGWADVGVDAGEFARELMSHSFRAVQEESTHAIDPARVLEKAHSSTKAKGSSTACIIALTSKVFCFYISLASHAHYFQSSTLMTKNFWLLLPRKHISNFFPTFFKLNKLLLTEILGK